ncbi:hypothetical protein TNCV_2618261 [Trichonephila clavipes]|nr:hypothetical protein TNCV_2618261 [Trichonephila clavipes]
MFIVPVFENDKQYSTPPEKNKTRQTLDLEIKQNFRDNASLEKEETLTTRRSPYLSPEKSDRTIHLKGEYFSRRDLQLINWKLSIRSENDTPWANFEKRRHNIHQMYFGQGSPPVDGQDKKEAFFLFEIKLERWYAME